MNEPLFTLGELIYLLYKRKTLLITSWFLILLLFVVYGLVSKKTWELEGTVSIGKFNEGLLEEGEFVARQFEDYSFISEALEEAGVTSNMPVSRLQKYIKAEVVNEIKKNKDVGLVRLRVRYKDHKQIVDVFNALTQKIIREHDALLKQSQQILVNEEDELRKLIDKTAQAVEVDVKMAQDTLKNTAGKTVPSLLLAEHNLTANRNLQSFMISNLYKVVLDREAVTMSVPTKLAAQPQLPDEPIRPIWSVIVISGCMAGGLFACGLVFLMEIIARDVKPRFENN